MTQQNTNIARQACFDVINSGGPLDKFLNSLNKDPQTFFDAVTALVDATCALRRDLNATITTVDAEANEFLALSRAGMLLQIRTALNTKDNERAGWLVSSMACMMTQCRGGRTFNEAPTTPAVLQMAITSMPTRETSSSIKLDGQGNIKTTTQTERDASPA